MNDNDRDTTPPPAALSAQLAEVRAALERVSEAMAVALPALQTLNHRLDQHELAIITAEHKIHAAFELERRVARIEDLITAAE